MDSVPTSKKRRLSGALTVLDDPTFNDLILNNPLPALCQVKIRDEDVRQIQRLFTSLHFRTAIVLSPRQAISLYLDSASLPSPPSDSPPLSPDVLLGRAFVLSSLGLHPLQSSLESAYVDAGVRDLHVLRLLCLRVLSLVPDLLPSSRSSLSALTSSLDSASRSAASDGDFSYYRSLLPLVPRLVSQVCSLAAAGSRGQVQEEQVKREHERLAQRNCTLANAGMQRLVEQLGVHVKDVLLKTSHEKKYERITITLYDPAQDQILPPTFVFLPSLTLFYNHSVEAVVKHLLSALHKNLLHNGYFAPPSLMSAISPPLESFFLSGLTPDVNLPFPLVAHFAPTFPLSLYLHGLPGAGKSSFVRNFIPALSKTIEEHLDAEMAVRFVKQNLNKPYKDLELELQLRPNNNDLSVMSIIQGRRMTLAQSKPGLVVVDLEEMPDFDSAADPNQLQVCKLISQRFGGRLGEFNDSELQEGGPPRNSARGISGDATLLTLVTSNYELHDEARDALGRLHMFKNAEKIHTTAVADGERRDFAFSYLEELLEEDDGSCKVKLALDIPVGSGDTRLLVRHLRMIAFYVKACCVVSGGGVERSPVSVWHDSNTSLIMIGSGGDEDEKVSQVQLRLSEATNNLLPASDFRTVDARADEIAAALFERLHSRGVNVDLVEFRRIMDYYFAATLAPAVIVSSNKIIIEQLVDVLTTIDGVRTIRDVNPDSYKMMRSLYDKRETPNLRDDILALGGGLYQNSFAARGGRAANCSRAKWENIAIHLHCATADAQLQIREIVEDSPSMTAFSSVKSALYKEGLLFAVYVEGAISKEVRSRASVIL